MRIPFWTRYAEGRQRWLKSAKKAFYILLALVGAALVFAFDATWPVLEEVLIIAIEFVEQELDHLYDDTLGLGHYYGQIATAWTGFFIFLALLVHLIKRGIRLAQRTKEQLPTWRAQKKEQVKSWWQTGVERFNVWWEPLSLTRKVAAGIAGVLIAIPLAWILSVVVTTLILAILGF